MVATLAAGRREPTAPAAGAACTRVASAVSTASADSAAAVDSTAAASAGSTAAAAGASVRDSPTCDDSGGRRNEHVALTPVEQDSRCSRCRLFGADRHDRLGVFVPEKANKHAAEYPGKGCGDHR